MLRRNQEQVRLEAFASGFRVQQSNARKCHQRDPASLAGLRSN